MLHSDSSGSLHGVQEDLQGGTQRSARSAHWPGADALLAAKLGLLYEQTANLRSSEVVPEATT